MLKSEQGVTLVEIMIAMVIFALGVSLAMRMLPESNVATTRGRNLTKATNFAQEKIEHLMAANFAEADLDAGDHVDPDNPIDNHFSRSWNVQTDTPISGMKRVAVTVSFETASKDSSVTLTTFVTSRR